MRESPYTVGSLLGFIDQEIVKATVLFARDQVGFSKLEHYMAKLPYGSAEWLTQENTRAAVGRALTNRGQDIAIHTLAKRVVEAFGGGKPATRADADDIDRYMINDPLFLKIADDITSSIIELNRLPHGFPTHVVFRKARADIRNLLIFRQDTEIVVSDA